MNQIKHISLLLAAMFAVNFAWAQIDTVCVLDPLGETYGLYSVDTDEQDGQGSVNAFYEWFVYLPDGVTEVPQAVITTQQGAEGSTNQIQVDWSNVTPGNYVVSVVETDTLTTCVGQPVSINVIVVDAIQPDVSCTSTTIDQVDFTWNSISGATSFTIEEFVNGVTTNQLAGYVATDYSVVGLSAGDSVTLIVTPIGSAEACFLPDTSACSTIPCDITAIQVSTTETTCGLDNGELQVVNVDGGTAPFTYSVDGVNYDVVSSFTDLAAGNVEVFVSDANGCLFSQTFTIVATPNSLVASAGLLTLLTCQDSIVFIAVTASGGQGPYTGAGLQEITEPGDYFYVVTDADGCTDTTNIVTVAPAAEGPIVSVEVNGILTCLITTVPVTVTASGGTAPYSGDIGTFNEGSGTFTYTVTDANGCEVFSDPITIAEAIEGPTASIDTLSGGTVGCGQEQVVLTVSATGGLPPYTNTGTYNVGPGFYTYTVTDDNDCPSTVSITIGGDTNPPSASIVASGLNLSCTDSLITLTSQFNAAEYQWLDGNNNVIGTGSSVEVTQGDDYILIVTASNNCTAQDSVTINQDAGVPSFDLIATANELNCVVTSITITAQNVTPVGGTFTWSNGAANVSEITVSTADTYEATYLAPNGCEVSQSVVITRDTSSVVVTITPTATELTCDIEQITLTATGADTYLWSTGETGPSIIVTTPSTYSVTGTTLNGCQDVDQEIITIDTIRPTPVINASDITLTCNVQSITLTASGGVTYNWGSGPSPIDTLDVINAGYYTVVVIGDNGCSDTTGIAISQEAEIPEITVLPSADPLTCATDTIILTASGALTYTWNGGLSVGATLVVTEPGVYTVVGVDENGCSGIGSYAVSQDTLSPFVEIINLSQNDLLTCDSTSVQVQAQGADSYVWSGGLGVSAFALITQADTYQVTGTNASNGCSATAEITISSDGNLPEVTINNLTGTFELGCDTVQIDIEVVTNIENGELVWTNGLPSSANQSLTSAGTYTVTVTDPLTGCVGQNSITITQDLSLPIIEVFNTTGTDTITCNLVPQEIALFATGGVEYEWQDVSGNVLSNGANLIVTLAGDYQVTVTGENGCTDFIFYQVYESLDLPNVQITAAFDTITCARPSIVLTASGASSYSWDTGAAGATITVFVDGAYTVEGEGSNGCVNTATYTIEIDTVSPGATINASLLVLTCQDSVATLSGAGDGAFEWNNGLSSDASIDVQDPGLYVLEVTGSNGCVSTDQIEINEDIVAPVALITPGGGVLTCQVDSILLTASGGVSYEWFDGSSSDQIYADALGTYSVVVTAANGCVDDASVEITQSADLPIVSIAPLSDTLNCNVPNTQLTASVLNGSVNYTWTNASNAVVGNAATLFVNQAGVYTAKALDANGCEGSAFVEVVGDFAVPVAEIISVTGPTELTCIVQAITLQASGGVSYTWNYGLGNNAIVNITQPRVDYEVVVTGLNGCDTTLTYEITQDIALPAVVINNLSGTNELTCLLDAIDVQAIGGFVYEWNNGLGFGPLQAIDEPGTYQVTATGQNGCRDSVEIAIIQDIAQPAINVVNLSGSNELTCALDTIEVTTLGAGEFVWSDAGDNVLSNSGDLAISQTGDYTLTVTGDNGCVSDSIFSFTQNITPPSLAIVNVTNATEITCATDSIQLSVNTNAVSFDWTPAILGSASTVFVTQQGNYSVTATGANGCEVIEGIAIAEDTELPGAVIATSSATNTLTCAEDVITLIPDGAGGYNWTGGGAEVGNSLEVTIPGTYALTVVGLNGCVSEASVVIQQDINAPIAVVLNDPNTSIITCATEQIDLTASGGSTYAWYDAFGSQLGALNVLTVDSAGTYTVVTTASNGCEDTLDVVITDNVITPTMSIANASGSQLLTCSLPTIQLTATGATEFEWTNSLGTVVSSIADLDVTVPDTYTVTGIAANGCQDTAQIVIGQNIADPLVSISNLVGSTTLTCSLDSIVLLAQGNGVSYSWSDGTSVLSNSALLQVEIAGVYEVTAIGSNGCDSIATISILSDGSTPLADIDLPLLNDTLTCAITSIELVASGGSSYAWSNGLGNGASVFVTAPGPYTVTVTSDATGCSADATIQIFGNTTPPSISIENITQEDTITCAIPSIALQASGALTYQWSNNNATTPILDVTDADVYEVIGTGVNGCIAIASYQVFEDIVVPLVTISNPSNNLQLTCDSTDIDVVAQGASIYSWSDQNGVVGNGANYSIDTPGTYTATGALPNGCSSSASIIVSENVVSPIASINNNTGGTTQLTCDLDTISLTATGGVQYSWSNGVSVVSSEADFIAGTPGNYVVTVTALNGCTDTAAVVITSDGFAPIAEITIPSGIDTLTCSEQSTTLVATGPYTFEWSDGSTQPTLTVTEPDVYTLTVTAANGCSASTSVTVAADTLAPSIILDNPLGLEELTCSVTSIAVGASGGVSYEWTLASTVVSNVAALDIVSPGVYTVLVTGTNGCVNTASLNITQDNIDPIVSIVSPEEGSLLTCDVTAIVLSAIGADVYSWTDAALNALGNLDSLVVIAPGLYTVTGTNANGCDATATFEITQNNLLPTAVITNNDAPATTLTCTLNRIDLTASGGVAYSWSNSTSVVSNAAELSVTAPATYTVTVTASNGCVDTESIVIGTDGSTPSLQLISSDDTLTCSVPSITLNAIGVGSLVWSVVAPAGSDCEVAGDPSIICSDVFIPVCGCNGQTYSNGCYAEREGVFYYVPGECGTPGASAVNISTPGTYTVTLTASNGCTTAQTVVISEDVAPPVLTITSDNPTNELTCADALIQLTANTTGSVNWSNNLGVNATVSVSNPDVYTVTATGTNGCVATDSIDIVQDVEAPVLVLDTLNNTATLTCVVTSVELSASGATEYTWTNSLNQVVSSTSALSVTAPGTFTLTAEGANGCDTSVVVNVGQDLVVPTVTLSTDDSDNQLTCADNSIVLSVTGTADSYVWSTGSTDTQITVGSAGDYFVTGTDAGNGCETIQSVAITSDGQLPVVAILADTTVLNCALTEILLTADTVANAFPVTLSWSNSLGSNAAVSVNQAGEYTVTATAANGCSSSATVIITEDLATANAVIVNNTGTTQLSSTVTAINVTATGGVSYVWSAGLGTNPTVNITNDGEYTVIVTGENGCQGFASIIITDVECIPPTVVISNIASADTLTCSRTSIEVLAQGATTYSWSNGLGNLAAATITAPGTYIVTGTNAEGCSATDTISIGQNIAVPNAGIINNTGTTQLTCAQNTINLTATGGVSYSWNNGLGSLASVVVGAPNFYTVTVTAENGCIDTASVSVSTDGSTPSVSITNNTGTTELTCTTTAISVTATGGVSYTWSGGLGNSANASITTPGSYTVTATASNGCTGTAVITVTQSNTITADITNNTGTTVLSCAQTSINVTATGGVSYSWSGGLGNTANAIITNAGSYTVTAIGANGCVDTTTVVVTNDGSAPQIDITNNTAIDTLTCAVQQINLTATGGGTYSWSNGLGNQAAAVVTQPGTYTVTSTGTNGCVGSASITIARDTISPVAGILNNSGTTILTCLLNNISVTANGGGTYSWSNGLGNAASASITSTGNYTVTVTSANGCTDTATISITDDGSLPQPSIVSSVTSNTLDCVNTSITLTGGGSGSYSWSNGTTNLGSGSSIVVIDPGTYTLALTASNGCSASTSVTITENVSVDAAIATDAPFIDCNNPDMILTASGGVSYLWANGNTSDTLTVYQGGLYSVTVIAANGCSETETITVAASLGAPIVTIDNNTGTTILGCNTNSINLVALANAVSYVWTNSAGNTVSNTADITVLNQGVYSVTATGANGCSASSSITITQDNTAPIAQISAAGSITVITCLQPSIVLTASGNGSYQWDNGLDTPTITVTEGGDYSLTVSAANGCTNTTSITITENNTAPVAGITNTSGNTILSCGVSSIPVTATGGGTYSWSGGLGSSANATITQPGTYAVTVTSSNGCSDTESIVITDDGSLPEISINASADALDCFTTAIDLTVTGANGTISWSVDGPDGAPCPTLPNEDLICSDFFDPVCGCNDSTYSNPCYAERVAGVLYYLPGECGSTNGATSITVSSPGVYTVTLIDANGCEAFDTYTIEENLEVPVATVASDSPICSNEDAEFTISGTAGDVVAYTLNGGTQQTITIEPNGSAAVIVEDPTGNQQIQLVSVSRGVCFNSLDIASTIVVNETPQAVATGPAFNLCEGAVLSLNAAQSEGASFSWTGPGGFTSDITPVLIPSVDLTDAGDYILTASIGNCVDTDTITVVVVSATTATQTVQICVGQTYTLPGGVIVSAEGTYTSVIDNSNACDSTVTTILEVVTSFNVNLSSTICEGDSLLMPDGTYENNAGTFEFEYISSGGCDSIVTVELTVNPTYYATQIVSICEGEDYTLPNGQVVTLDDVYEVAYTTINGCDSIWAYDVNVLPVPATVNIALTLCPGETQTLVDGQVVSANGVYTVELVAANSCDSIVVYTATYYQDYRDTVEVTICNGEIYELPNGQLADATNDYVIFDEQSVYGCDSSLVYRVTELPVLSSAQSVNLCYNEVFTTPDGNVVGADGEYEVFLTSSTGCDSLVTYQVQVGEQIIGEPQQRIACFGETALLPDGTEVSVSGEYVSILDAVNGCDSLIITNVVAFPFLFTEFSDFACEGESYALPDGSQASQDGIYPVELTSQFGCDSIVQVTVDFTPMVMVSIIPEADSLELCQGDTTLLIADGAMTYAWESSDGVLLTNAGAIVDIAPMDDAWVTVTGTGLACSARDSIYLTVNPAPALDIVAPTAICMGDSVTISASGADSLFWMPNEFISCASCDEITVSPAQSTVFTLSGYNGQCFGTTSLAMEVQEVPVSEVYGDTLVCAFSPADLFVLGGTTYVWSTGDTTSAISVQPGETSIYTVVAISGICSDTSFITVEAIPLPQIEAGNDTLITLGGEVQLNATGGNNYVWSPATDLSCTNCPNPLAIPAESITYCVEGIAESGCSDTSCLRIEVTDECETFFIPNAFAPESGGHEMNDCFRVFGEECFGSMRIRIFGRWGELVYESTEFGDCWDGNYQGKKVNTGVFVYYFDGVLLNGEPFYRKGNVTVIR